MILGLAVSATPDNRVNMIRLVFHDAEGKTNLVLGISGDNVNHLQAGKVIRVNLRDMNVMIDGDVSIYFRQTEGELEQEIAKFIGPETKVNIGG